MEYAQRGERESGQTAAQPVGKVVVAYVQGREVPVDGAFRGVLDHAEVVRGRTADVEAESLEFWEGREVRGPLFDQTRE